MNMQTHQNQKHLMTPDEFFSDKTLAKQLFALICRQVETIGAASVQTRKSQIAFRRRHNFAAVWLPEQYLKRKTAPLVLTIFLPWRAESPRWKEVVEPAPGRFTHHLELYDTPDIDEEVRNWLRNAWEAA